MDRDAIIAELADQIRDAIEAGERWKPDYQALMARTGFRQSWAEKVGPRQRARARGRGPELTSSPPPGERPRKPAWRRGLTTEVEVPSMHDTIRRGPGRKAGLSWGA